MAKVRVVEKKVWREFTVGFTKAISPSGLLGATPGDGPLRSGESTAVSSGEVLLAPHATRHHSLCNQGV